MVSVVLELKIAYVLHISCVYIYAVILRPVTKNGRVTVCVSRNDNYK
jgi:hypothetical protein